MNKLKIHGVELYNSTLYITHKDRNGIVKRGLPLPVIRYSLKDLEFVGNNLVEKNYDVVPFLEDTKEVFTGLRISKYHVYDNSEGSVRSLFKELQNFKPKYEYVRETWKMINGVIRTASIIKFERIDNLDIIDDNFMFNIEDINSPENESGTPLEMTQILKQFFKLYNPILKKRVQKKVKDLMYNLRYGNSIINNYNSFDLGNLYNYQLFENDIHDSDDCRQPIRRLLGRNVTFSFNSEKLINKSRQILIKLEIAKGFNKEYNIPIKELMKGNTRFLPQRFLEFLIECHSDLIKTHTDTIRESNKVSSKKC